MTLDEFKGYLDEHESSILDFKKDQYFFHKEKEDKTDAFVKDIISFTNTIRVKSAYIILGIEILPDGQKNLCGISNSFDDSIFQEKIKNKTTPIPEFLYYTIVFENKKFGIIEIPVRNYPEPIFATLKLKGIEPGMVYIRRGSSNSIATGREIILLNEWLKSIPKKHESPKTFKDELSSIVIKITSDKYKLSECFAETLSIANKYNIIDLRNFCAQELKGWYNIDVSEQNGTDLSYRINEVIVSTQTIELNPYSPFSSYQVLNQLKSLDGFHTQRLLFSQPVDEIESMLTRIKETATSIISITLNTKDRTFLGKKISSNVYAYTNRDCIEKIYSGIKQNLLSRILEHSSPIFE